jgi:hypothetical protein
MMFRSVHNPLCAIAFSLSLWSLFLFPGASAAADAAFCGDYAAQAAQDAALAAKFNCAYHGPRWTLDEDAHQAWCRAATKMKAEEEARARGEDVRLCLCQWYADRAVAQARESAKRNCPYDGPRWSPDGSQHYRWCVSAKASLATLQSEVKTRDALLADCGR